MGTSRVPTGATPAPPRSPRPLDPGGARPPEPRIPRGARPRNREIRLADPDATSLSPSALAIADTRARSAPAKPPRHRASRDIGPAIAYLDAHRAGLKPDHRPRPAAPAQSVRIRRAVAGTL